MTGHWPDPIDHESGDGTDNRWCNLQSVTCQENGCNKRTPSNNTSGVTGVSLKKSTGRWQSSIKVNQVQFYLGSFIDFFEAVCARKSAEVSHGFHINHGSVRPL